MKAIVYLKKMYCEDRQQGYELEARDFAKRRGYEVVRTVVEADADVLPWLLIKVGKLDIDAIVTPTMHHISRRAQDVLDRCDLLVVYPSASLSRGTRLSGAVGACGA